MRKIGTTIVVFLLMLSLCLQVLATGDIKQDILAAVERERPVHLSDYQLTLEEFWDLYYQMRSSGELPWYYDYNFSYSDYKGIVDTVTPYMLDAEVYDRLTYELAMAELIHEVILPDMNQTQMALAVHDYLITHCVYDESLEKNTGYDLLINGSTVCAGYADLYMDVLTRLGIECVCVISEPMNHMWNLVCLDGEWYHVDVTWDDPTPDIQGRVEHTYFLLSDEQISSGDDPHYDWETEIVCDSEHYAKAFWRDVSSPIVYRDADNCILRKDKNYVGSVYVYRESTGELTKLTSNKSQYVSVGRGQCAYWHTGMSIWNGRIYYNNMNTVYSTDMEGKDRREEYSHKTQTEKSFIIGSFVENDVLHLTLSDHDFEQLQTKQVQLADSGYHRHSYTTENVPAGCVTPEYICHGCSCGVQMHEKIGPANGHSMTLAEVQENALCIGCENCTERYELTLPEGVFFRWLKVF